MLYESLFPILRPRSSSIVFQRWLRKFHFQHLIFLIFLRFRSEFCNFSNFSCGSFFELGIFKNWSQTSQNDSQDAPGSILRPFEKHHFSSFWWKFSHSCRVFKSPCSRALGLIWSRLLRQSFSFMSLIFCLGARNDWTFTFLIQDRSLPQNCIFWKMPSFFVEVESWPKCPQLAIYSSRQSSTSHSEPRSALNSFSALAEKISFSTPHFSHFPPYYSTEHLLT